MGFWKSTRPTGAVPASPIWKGYLCRLEDLPMFPSWAAEALEVANRPDCSLRDLARVIQRDLLLSAGILKLANSSLYCVGREVTSIEQAVIRLGLVRCRHAIVAVGMRSLWRETARQLSPRWAQFLWHHALFVAAIASRLARCLHLPFQGEELVAGLAHDLGRLVLALQNCPAPLAQQSHAFLESPDVLAQEREHLGADHTQIGTWFLQINRLPAFLADVAEFHHHPERAGQRRDLVALIAVAEDLANLWYAALHSSAYELRMSTNDWLRNHFGCTLNGSREIPPSPEIQAGPYRGLHPVQVILQEAAREVQQNAW